LPCYSSISNVPGPFRHLTQITRSSSRLCDTPRNPPPSFPSSNPPREPPGPGIPSAFGGDPPPHPECWQCAGAELRYSHRLIHDEWRRKSVLIVDLDRVIGRSGDVAPVERNVCSWREARVCSRTD